MIAKTLTLALALLSHLALASPGPQITEPPSIVQAARCFTYTVLVPVTSNSPRCPQIKCIAPLDCTTTITTTTTVPCKNKNCPITPTRTVTGKPRCPTCPGMGCGVKTTTTSIVTSACATLYTNPVEPPY